MKEQDAKERVKDLKRFYVHLLSFLVVNTICLTTFSSGPGELIGPLMVFLSWGAGLCFHAMRVYGLMGMGSTAWEEQKVRELVRSGEKGLSKEDLVEVLQNALKEASAQNKASSDDRILQRLRHLEAIVTSEDWDLLQELKGTKELIDRSQSETLSKEQQIGQIAKRVR